MAHRELSPATIIRLELLFAPSERGAAKKLLVEECGNNLPFLEKLNSIELERYRFAALKTSRGNLDKLRVAIEVGKQDWRDLLVGAGFGDDINAHNLWMPEPKGHGWISVDSQKALDELDKSICWEDTATVEFYGKETSEPYFPADISFSGYRNKNIHVLCRICSKSASFIEIVFIHSDRVAPDFLNMIYLLKLSTFHAAMR